MKGRRSDTPLIWLLTRAALLAAVGAAAVALMRPAPSTPGPGGGAGGHSGDTLVRRRGRNAAGAPARRRRHLAGVAPGVAAAGALARGVRADPARPLWSRPPARGRRPIDRCARRRGRRAARSSWDRPGAHRRQLARRVDRPGAGPPRTGPVGRPLRPGRRVAVGGAHDRRRHRVAAVVRPARQASRPRGGDRPSAVGAATAARDAGRTPRPRRPGRVRGLDPGDEGLPRGRPAAAGDHEAPAGNTCPPTRPARSGWSGPNETGSSRSSTTASPCWNASRAPSSSGWPAWATFRCPTIRSRSPASFSKSPMPSTAPTRRIARSRRLRPTSDRARRAEWQHRIRTMPRGAARRP